MAGSALQQRCWNHDAREAASRCLACGRAYCRECVTEHEGRLLCAACLAGIAPRAAARPSRLRRLAPTGMIAAGLLLAWLVFWAVGEGIITYIRRLEQEPRSANAHNLAAASVPVARHARRKLDVHA